MFLVPQIVHVRFYPLVPPHPSPASFPFLVARVPQNEFVGFSCFDHLNVPAPLSPVTFLRRSPDTELVFLVHVSLMVFCFAFSFLSSFFRFSACTACHLDSQKLTFTICALASPPKVFFLPSRPASDSLVSP